MGSGRHTGRRLPAYLRTRALLPVAAGALLGTPAAAGAASDPAAILAGVDAAATAAADLSATLNLTITEKDGARTERRLLVWQAGTDRRMAKFDAPPAVRGVGLLSRGDEGTFLYLPEFGRVRRIVGRSRGDSFFGTDFTNDDLARVRYVGRYRPSLLAEDGAGWTLGLEAIHPDDEPWRRVVIRVRRADHVIARAEFFDAVGPPGGGGDPPPVRRIEASDIQIHGVQAVAHRIVAEDLRSGRKTVAVLDGVKADAGLDDDFFTQRHLMRSP